MTRPRPGQFPFRSPREWAGAGPEGKANLRKVGTGRRFSADRARSNLGEGQGARRKRQASEQSPEEKQQEQSGMWGYMRTRLCPLPSTPVANYMADLYLQRKWKQLLPQALWYKGP